MKMISGLTLVELLVGLFLTSLVLLGLFYITASTANDTTRLTRNANLVKEGQIAQQIISGRLAEAIYVWPSGVDTNMLFGTSGATTKNTVDTNVTSGPAASQWQWRFGTNSGSLAYIDPATGKPYAAYFVAMILPPINSPTATNCTGTGEGATPGSTLGCYRLFAYFPMRRSILVNDSSVNQSSKPKADPLNDFPADPTKDRWVLMEYRANLYNAAQPFPAWDPGYSYGGAKVITPSRLTMTYLQPYYLGRTANVLVDYVKPNSVSFRVYRPDPGDITGTIVGAAAATNTGKVDFTFQMERLTSTGSMTGSTGVLGGSVTPRNWYCPTAMVSLPFALNCP